MLLNIKNIQRTPKAIKDIVDMLINFTTSSISHFCCLSINKILPKEIKETIGQRKAKKFRKLRKFKCPILYQPYVSSSFPLF